MDATVVQQNYLPTPSVFRHADNMLLFLASVLEQLDLALEHVSKRDVHNARFGLMLTDNAVELVLHQIAKDKATELKMWAHKRDQYPNQKPLEKAMGRKFGEKVKFARLEGRLNPKVARSIQIMHEYRNEVYHIGLQHEEILPELAAFYLDIACEFIATYKTMGLGWGSGQTMPERAKKYFKGEGFFPGSWEDFRAGCSSIRRGNGHIPSQTVTALVDHLEQVINEQDLCINIVADGVYEGQQRTRDRAVVETQAWGLAFSEQGKALAAKQEWNGSVLGWVEWLADNHKFAVQSDPISAWRNQLTNLSAKTNAHAALDHYYSFIVETAELRDALSDSATAAEAEIDAAVDRMRGK